MTTRFKNAYDALIKAFFEGTLAKGHCYACACGNIIRYATNEPIQIKNGKVFGYEGSARLWSLLIVTGKPGEQHYNHRDLPQEVIKQIEDEVIRMTGYNAIEFGMIEEAFESNTRKHINRYPYLNESEILNDQFNGLMAVVDVLLELDNMKDEGYKESFKAHPKLVLIEN